MTDILPATPDNIARAAALLGQGGLVAFPTETVYGLAADATNGKAVAAIFEAKGRPQFNPLICHVASTDMARRHGRFTPLAEKLATLFWPGPLTLIVEKSQKSGISDLATSGLATVALRMPSGIAAHALIEKLGRPVAAPSANGSGRISPTTAAHVLEDLNSRIDIVLDDGPCSLGLESTIIDATGDEPVLLRAGAISKEELEAVLGNTVRNTSSVQPSAPAAPGMLSSHYAPSASVRLNATTTMPGEALLAFGAAPITHGGPALNLSKSGDLREAAANLFAYLRELDKSGAHTIAVMAIPATGLGAAINDRLQRAAAPRS